MTNRPTVEWFSILMENKLQKHDLQRGSRGWLADGLRPMMDRLQEEVEELNNEVSNVTDEHEMACLKIVVEEAVDVANIAMMIADIADILGDEAVQRRRDVAVLGKPVMGDV